eukprot:33104_3
MHIHINMCVCVSVHSHFMPTGQVQRKCSRAGRGRNFCTAPRDATGALATSWQKRESLIARLGTIIDNGFSVRRRCDDPPLRLCACWFRCSAASLAETPSAACATDVLLHSCPCLQAYPQSAAAAHRGRACAIPCQNRRRSPPDCAQRPCVAAAHSALS